MSDSIINPNIITRKRIASIAHQLVSKWGSPLNSAIKEEFKLQYPEWPGRMMEDAALEYPEGEGVANTFLNVINTLEEQQTKLLYIIQDLQRKNKELQEANESK